MALTDSDAIAARMGAEFVAWLGAAHVNAIPSAILWAKSKILFYCQRRATLEQLETNDWAKSAATTLACFKCSGYGGEPHNATTKEEADDVLAELREIADLKADIPELVYTANDNQNKGAGPVVSNLAVDVGRMPMVRVVGPASTGRPAGYPFARDYPTSHPRRT